MYVCEREVSGTTGRLQREVKEGKRKRERQTAKANEQQTAVKTGEEKRKQ